MGTIGAGELFAYSTTIQESRLDSFGHLNNAQYLALFEDARWEIIRGRGYGIPRIRELGLGPVILGVELKFLRELVAGTPVVIRSQLQGYAGKIGKFRQWMEGPGGVSHCDALFTIGLFDIAARKLVPPTPEWLRAIGSEP
jgi:YbgC/YbaW family acyl-CoA thioester hydrolase